MSANLNNPARSDILQLIGDMGVRGGVQVQQKLRKHYLLDSSESCRIILVR